MSWSEPLPPASDEPLIVRVVDGNVVISIGVDTLLHALAVGREAAFDDDNVRVTSPEDYVQSIVDELLYEEDDGYTVIHAMFDQASERAIDNGCAGIQIIE